MYNEMTGGLDWERVRPMRESVDRYFKRLVEKDEINIPMYDLFVTELRKDWESAGFDLTDEKDLFKLWTTLGVTCSAMAFIMTEEVKDRQDMSKVLRVVGTYANMVGLFLREMTRNHDAVPPLQ